MAQIHAEAHQVNSLIQLLGVNNDGDDLARADKLYRDVMAACTEHVGDHHANAKGELNLKIIFQADNKGVDVTIESSAKTPKPPVTKSRYFATEDGDGLTLKNPNRGTMFDGVNLGRRRAGDPL